MERLKVIGGNPLCGTVEISGAKNAVLPILAATVVRGGTYVLNHCPNITDVSYAVEIIHTLGGQVVRSGDTLLVDTGSLNSWTVPQHLMLRMRASVLFLGALLARFGRAVIAMPGGCPLGRRPIDLHLQALAQMGAAVTLCDEEIRCEAESLHGCEIALPFPSVGATENALLAATAVCGTVVVKNAAREPEIVDLIRFLQTMGAEIDGAGTQVLRIRGNAPLKDAAHSILPDRIETATFLCAAAACGGDVTLARTDPGLLYPVTEALSNAGCVIRRTRDGIRICSDGCLQAIGEIRTAPYPGFPTDAQALLMATLLRAEGETCFFETVFERRMTHAAQLRRFGGQIETIGGTALVRGVRRLYGAQAEAGDLRAAAALIIAALQAPEESEIVGIKHLHRGYDNLEEKLLRLGAEISEKTTGNFLADGV